MKEGSFRDKFQSNTKVKKKKKKEREDSEAKFLVTRKKKAKKLKIKVPVYVKQKCAYTKDGKQCKLNAVGKSTLCKKHGGNPIVIENTLPPKETKAQLLLTNSTFNPAVHPLSYISAASNGASDVEIAAQFLISLTTLKKWSERYKEFAIAYEIGQALHESWWLKAGKDGLQDRHFNTSLFKFLTGNKLGYSDKIENRNINMNIHGVLLVPDKMTEDEWESANEEDAIEADYEVKETS
jgi:hypothetical protein